MLVQEKNVKLFSDIEMSLTAFEKERQMTARSKSPIPITCRVWRLTEFQILTWGYKI